MGGWWLAVARVAPVAIVKGDGLQPAGFLGGGEKKWRGPDFFLAKRAGFP